MGSLTRNSKKHAPKTFAISTNGTAVPRGDFWYTRFRIDPAANQKRTGPLQRLVFDRPGFADRCSSYKFYTRLPWAEPKKQFPIRGKSLWVGAAEFRLRPARWRGRATAAFEITRQWRYASAAIGLLKEGGGGVTSKTSTIVAGDLLRKPSKIHTGIIILRQNPPDRGGFPEI